MLTKTERKALLWIWYKPRHLIFIERYIKSQKDREGMPKKVSLIEILWLEKYNEFVVALQKVHWAK